MSALVVAALAATGCAVEAPPIPSPAAESAFPIVARPSCSDAVLRARVALDAQLVAQVARSGGTFTCGDVERPLPLDEAVARDAPATVRALLEAGTDPNARWTPRGDRFPLQGALEARFFGGAGTHRREIVELLLAHGADANARWCPFESRGPSDGAWPVCTSAKAMTPLIMATLLDDAPVISLLLSAKADPVLEDWQGCTALDYARSEDARVYLKRDHDARPSRVSR